MPAVTLYRLLGGDTDLTAYVNTDVVGQPKKTETANGVSMALWRKKTVPDAPPAWATVVRDAFPGERFQAPGAHDNALIIVAVPLDGKVAYWAMAFGAAGWRWLEPSEVDRAAHLVAALEVLRDPTTGVVSGLTRVIAIDLTREAQRITRDMSQENVLAAYQFDRDIQAFRGAKAKLNNSTLGRTLTAGDSIHLTSIDDFEMALDAVRTLERAVQAGRLRAAPVPGVAEVTDSNLTATLDGAVVAAIKGSGNNVALVLPDDALDRPLAVDGSGRTTGIESFDLADLRAGLAAAGKLAALDIYALAELELIDPAEISAEPVAVWPRVAAAITHAGKLYLLEDDRWYVAPANWLAAVNARVDGCPTIDDFPAFAHRDENDYNAHGLAPHFSSAVCLDRRLTSAPGFGKSGIEILDVLAKGDRGDGVATLRFVAVKRGLLSQKMSHLFAQVKTAADSLQDSAVRTAFLDVVRASTPPPDLLVLAEEILAPENVYDASRIEMIIAIVGSWRPGPVSASVPVLGRAGLQQSIGRLVALGHHVSIARVATVVTTKAKKSGAKTKKSAAKKKGATRRKKR